MTRFRCRHGAQAALVVIGLIAANPAQADVHPSHETIEQSQPDGGASLQRELLAFPHAKISAAAGVALAERRLAGSQVVDISFDGRQDRPIYHVKTMRGGQIWEGRIDAATGHLVGSVIATPIDQFPGVDQRRIADLVASKIGIADAIAIAESTGDGKAISAGLNEADGHFAFLVVVVSDGQLKAVSIDPTDAAAATKRPRAGQPVSAR